MFYACACILSISTLKKAFYKVFMKHSQRYNNNLTWLNEVKSLSSHRLSTAHRKKMTCSEFQGRGLFYPSLSSGRSYRGPKAKIRTLLMLQQISKRQILLRRLTDKIGILWTCQNRFQEKQTGKKFLEAIPNYYTFCLFI